jgi:hypothetical protein
MGFANSRHCGHQSAFTPHASFDERRPKTFRSHSSPARRADASASSMGETKIFPSPIRPVRAADDRSTTRRTWIVHQDLELHLGQNSTRYSARGRARCASAAEAFASVIVMRSAHLVERVLYSSSLKGLMMASIL